MGVEIYQFNTVRKGLFNINFLLFVSFFFKISLSILKKYEKLKIHVCMIENTKKCKIYLLHHNFFLIIIYFYKGN